MQFSKNNIHHHKLRPMRFCISLLLFILIVSPNAFAGRKLRVLFIGNSYTYVNDLPQVTADISASMGDTLVFDSYTVGGYTLAQHSNDPLSIQKINSAQWDYVILQEQSIEPAEPDWFVASYYAARYLDQIIAANDSCTKVMYYMTWGYKNGEPSFCATTWPAPCTYEGMDSVINIRYRAYADSAVLAMMGYSGATISGFQPSRQSQVSPVGAVRHYIRHQYPSIELYQTDGSHPTEAGTYAAGCTFYTALFHKDPLAIPYNYTLSASDAVNIRNAAKLIAYDSMHHWQMDIGLHAQFGYTIGTGNAVSFNNTSTAANSYVWDFGDGNTSTSSNPTHTYTTGGTYLVRLLAYSSFCVDTSFAKINSTATSIKSVNEINSDLVIYPNPATESITIQAEKTSGAGYHISIVNTLGQQVYCKENIAANQSLDISGLAPGVYFIHVQTGEQITGQYKLLKL